MMLILVDGVDDVEEFYDPRLLYHPVYDVYTDNEVDVGCFFAVGLW